MCVACTPYVGGTTINSLVYIITGSVECGLFVDMISHIVIQPFIPQGSNAHV